MPKLAKPNTTYCRDDHPLAYGKTDCNEPAASEVFDTMSGRWVPVCDDFADLYGAQGARLRTLPSPMEQLGDILASQMVAAGDDDDCEAGR